MNDRYDSFYESRQNPAYRSTLAHIVIDSSFHIPLTTDDRPQMLRFAATFLNSYEF